MGVWSVVVNGVPVDIDAVYGTRTTAVVGAGMPPLAHNTTEQALLPGALFQSVKVKPRVLQLTIVTPGSSLANYHSIRKDLLGLFAPNVGGSIQPVELRYSGSGTTVAIRALYEGGLEGSLAGQNRWLERIAVRFICYDPYWYEVTDATTALDGNKTIANANYAVKRVDGVWTNVSAAFNGTVYVVLPDTTGGFYVGGAFTDVGDANGDRIVYVAANGNITSLGTGMSSGEVIALALDAAGNLYAAGTFASAGGVADTVRIAKWNGMSWSALDTGLNHTVYALAISQDGSLYAGGLFTAAGGVAGADMVAKWDGASWSALGSITRGTKSAASEYVAAIKVGLDGDIYVGGWFDNLGGVSGANNVAKWDGAAWSALGTLDYSIDALAVAPDGSLYAGGRLAGVPPILARWHGRAWTTLGPGFVGDGAGLSSLAADGAGGIYVSGNFTAITGLALANRLAYWNGSVFSHVPIDLPGDPVVYSIIVTDDGNLYVGYSTSGTARAAEQTTVTNPGTAPAYPIVTITRNGGTAARVEYLANETTGHRLYLNYPLLDGETLTVDLTPGAKAVTSSYYGNVIGRALLPNSDFASWCLQPGDNTISLYVYEDGSPTVTADVSFYAPHLSADGGAA